MSQVPPPVPSNETLDFGKAQYDGAVPSAPTTCAACQVPIAGVYYTAGQALVCPSCRDAMLSQTTGGSPAKRALLAMALGLAGGLAGALIWFLVRRGTGYEIGLIAIVVGLLVGAGVRKGANHRGGWFYQAMAVLITYCSIAGQYMPDVLEAFFDDYRSGDAAMVSDSDAAEGDTMAVEEPGNPADAAAASEPADEESPSLSAGLFAVAALLAITFIIALAAPFLGGAQSVIGLLIIGFALYQAWSMNKRQIAELAGPFQLTPTPQPT